MKLIVWHRVVLHEGKYRSAIIATRNKKRVCEILKISLYELNKYWSNTGNEKLFKIASEYPNNLFVNMGSEFSYGDYKRVNP